MEPAVIFQEQHIYFPKGYSFSHGYLEKKKEIPYSIINEFHENTFPPSLLINNNEIIFLEAATAEEVKKSFEGKNIPVTSPVDVWSLIAEEFLDTEFGEEAKERTFQMLASVGIYRDEVIQIRKEIENRMLALTALTWEWNYYGQWDVLKQLWPLTDKKYWWTMEIALRQKSTGDEIPHSAG